MIYVPVGNILLKELSQSLFLIFAPFVIVNRFPTCQYPQTSISDTVHKLPEVTFFFSEKWHLSFCSVLLVFSCI